MMVTHEFELPMNFAFVNQVAVVYGRTGGNAIAFNWIGLSDRENHFTTRLFTAANQTK